MQKFKILLLSFLVALASCSKDDPNEEVEQRENPNLENCTMESADQGCALVYLDGKTGWVRIAKQGNLADPMFMYPSGQNDEPYGTVTIFLENGSPMIRLNDMVLDDYVVKVSQNSDGSNPICKAQNNVENPDTSDGASEIRVTGNLQFPFYMQLQVNVCF